MTLTPAEQVALPEDSGSAPPAERVTPLVKDAFADERADYVAQLEEFSAYADEGWTWLGVALRSLGVKHVFQIPEWKHHLSRELAEQEIDLHNGAERSPSAERTE